MLPILNQGTRDTACRFRVYNSLPRRTAQLPNGLIPIPTNHFLRTAVIIAEVLRARIAWGRMAGFIITATTPKAAVLPRVRTSPGECCWREYNRLTVPMI